MKTYFAPHWPDYQLLDSGKQQRLEKFGPYLIVKPDPMANWQPQLSPAEWNKATAIFSGKPGQTDLTWQIKNQPANSQITIDNLTNQGWPLSFGSIKFYARLTPYKHVGFFPEQAFHWQWLEQLVKTHQSSKPLKALNLFAYTGVSSLVLASLGVKVTHVDSSYPAIAWAKKNQELSNLPPDSIRWIREDALKFVQREVKRGNQYHIILLDPPGFGHGPHKEKWSFNQHFPLLLKACRQILAPDALALLVNAYTQSSSILSKTFLQTMADLPGNITLGKLAIANKTKIDNVLTTGIFARWEK